MRTGSRGIRWYQPGGGDVRRAFGIEQQRAFQPLVGFFR
jgi:hypothetical protein